MPKRRFPILIRPQFSVAAILWFLTFVAAASGALAKPSGGWVALYSCVIGVVLACAGSNIIARPNNQRIFWIAFCHCLLGLLCSGEVICELTGQHYGPFGDLNLWQSLFGENAWRVVHGALPYSNNIVNGFRFEDFVHFSAAYLSILALTFSTITAIVCQLTMTAAQ